MADQVEALRTRRGPYKQYITNRGLSIPRQTLSNWRNKLSLCNDSIATEDLPTQQLREASEEPPELVSPAELCSPPTSPSLSAAAELSRSHSPGVEQPMSRSRSPSPCTSSEDCMDHASPSSSSSIPHGIDHDESLLYPGARMTETMGLQLLHTLSMRHGLTRAAFGDILKVIGLHFPAAHNIPHSYRSVHCLLQASKMRTHTENVHKLCSDCGELIKSDGIEIGDCMHFDCIKFYELPIDKQLQDLFSGDKEFYALLQGRFHHSNDGTLRDICDGKAYNTLMSPGNFLTSPTNITLLMNTDGAQVFNSSTCAIWPVFFVINELPPHLRYLQKYTLLAGLWCAEKQPPAFQYLQPIMETCKSLELEGFNVLIGGEEKVCKVKVLCATFDLPAKAKVLEFTYFNGRFGCTVCKEEGIVVKVGRGNTRVFKPSPPLPLRSHDECYSLGRKALLTGQPQFGVKGLSALHILPSFDVVHGVCIDYMHCVLEGVTKKMVTLWFTVVGQPYSIKKHVAVANERLKSIKPPNIITRTPREVDHAGKWKASEYRAWLLYYSIPVLQGLLPKIYHEHLELLVCSMHIMLSDEIRRADLSLADQMIEKFCVNFELLYGTHNCTMNVHLLRHLAHYVRLYGPLWTHSCFWFEGLNGKLLKMFNGMQHVGLQIISNWEMTKNSQCLELEREEEDAQRVLLQLHDQQSIRRHNWEKIADTIYCVGGKKKEILDQSLLKVLHLSHVSGPLETFSRLYKKGEIYWSEWYGKATRRNNAVVQFEGNEFGEIQFYVFHSSTASAVYRPLSVISSTLVCRKLQSIIHHVRYSCEFRAELVTQIKHKCVLTDFENEMYVITIPNVFETD